jgi:hypothetical protein
MNTENPARLLFNGFLVGQYSLGAPSATGVAD